MLTLENGTFIVMENSLNAILEPSITLLPWLDTNLTIIGNSSTPGDLLGVLPVIFTYPMVTLVMFVNMVVCMPT